MFRLKTCEEVAKLYTGRREHTTNSLYRRQPAAAAAPPPLSSVYNIYKYIHRYLHTHRSPCSIVYALFFVCLNFCQCLRFVQYKRFYTAFFLLLDSLSVSSLPSLFLILGAKLRLSHSLSHSLTFQETNDQM